MTNDLQVSQRAREAAAQYATTHVKYSLMWSEAPSIRRGLLDEWEVVQAFAKFERDLLAEREGLREALEKAQDTLEIYADPCGYTDANGDQLSADDHPGLLAASTLAIVTAALKDNQP